MTERCPGCPVPGGLPCYGLPAVCESMADPATRERFAAHHAAFLAGRASGQDDAAATADGEARPSVAEAIAVLREMHACPHRTEDHECGCGGLARCGLGRGRQSIVSHNECRECLRERGLVQSIP